MHLDIENKVALVSASSQGLGKAVALALAGEGARVVLCGRNRESLAAARREIEDSAAVEVRAFPADLTVAADIDRLVKQTTLEFGTVHILVNNAGGPPAGYFSEMSDEQWRQGFELTLMSSVRLTRAVLPLMQRQKWGRIVNLTSISVKQPIKELLLSNSLRMAVIGWAKTVSNQVARDGITVNNVCPGWTRTDHLLEILKARADGTGTTLQAVEAGLTDTIPTGKLGEPEELANLVAFLASERASYMTGTSIQVDGGIVQAPY